MTIEEAIKVAVEMNDWRRREFEMPGPMPHSPKEFGKAIDALITHAKRTTWQPIETITKNVGDILVYRPRETFKPVRFIHKIAGKWRDAGGWNYPLNEIKGDYTHFMPAPAHPKETK